MSGREWCQDAPDSGNYYEDIAARAELPPEKIDELRNLNILYDTDQRGAFFQAHTATMETDFFTQFHF